MDYDEGQWSSIFSCFLLIVEISRIWDYITFNCLASFGVLLDTPTDNLVSIIEPEQMDS